MPESAAGKTRQGGRPRLWSVIVRLKPADGPHFCRQDCAQPGCLVATVAPGSMDGRSYFFDRARLAAPNSSNGPVLSPYSKTYIKTRHKLL